MFNFQSIETARCDFHKLITLAFSYFLLSLLLSVLSGAFHDKFTIQ